MDFNNIRVLVLDASGRQTISIVRGLKKIGCHVTVLCYSKLDLCYVSHYPDVKLLRSYGDTPETVYEAVTEEIKTGKYDVLMPISEYSTDWVTSHEEEYKKYVKLACATRDVYMHAFNKQITFETAMDIGINCPKTRRENETVEEFLASVDMPIIIKPRSGVGSIGFKKITDADQLRELISSGNVDPDKYVIQKCIEFDSRCYADIAIDKDGNVKAALAAEITRQYPVEAGTGTFSITIDDEQIIEDSAKLLRALGWVGFAQVSCLRDKKTGKAVLCEINGRIPAGILICELCGINIAQLQIELAYGGPFTQFPTNKKAGIGIRHTQADILWFLKSPDRFKAKPSWFSNKNTHDYLFSWSDPLPSIVYTFQQMTHYKGNMKKRSRKL